MTAARIKQYGIISAPHPNALSAAVGKLIEQGFQPLGGISVAVVPGPIVGSIPTITFYQTVVSLQDDDEAPANNGSPHLKLVPS